MSKQTGMDEHTDVGAYSLGLLEQADREAFEEHLAGCESCAAELAELSPMADLLRGVEPVEAAGEPPAEATVTQLIRRRATRQRYRARWQGAVGVAAGLLLLAGGIAVGIAAAPQGSQPALTGQLHSAASARAAGTVSLVAKAWGTQITLDLSKVHGPLRCDLVAVSKTGETEVALAWMVPVPGDGVPGHPAHLVIQGGTGIAMKNLARVDINVVHGGTLLSIPV
jgi:predicted anti-sigma-YlaC factor YlaD